jgi:hypothetical protein
MNCKSFARFGWVRVGLLAGFCTGWGGGAARGQDAVAPASTATITGMVICADTNGPARLAQVILRSTTPSNAGAEVIKGLEELQNVTRGDGASAKSELTKEQAAAQAKQRAELARTAAMMADSGHTVPVDMNGTYRFTNVPPGTYQIRVVLDGYIDPLGEFSPEDFASKDPGMQKKIAAAAPMVTITGNDGAHIDLRLERGGSISGRVAFDDGSPAIGWQVLEANAPAKGDTNPFGSGGGFLGAGGVKNLLHLPVKTDDTGHFRISGLASGEYVLQARVNLIGMDRGGFAPISSGAGIGLDSLSTLLGTRLTVYSGGGMHVADAKTISVKAGEDRTGVEIVVPLHTMHMVSGRVLAKTDAHAVNFGTVELEDKSDSSVQFTATIHDDGSFRFDYLPGDSSYVLTTHNVQDAVTTGTTTTLGTTIAKKKTVRNYDQVSEEIKVLDSDVDGVNVSVPALQ